MVAPVIVVQYKMINMMEKNLFTNYKGTKVLQYNLNLFLKGFKGFINMLMEKGNLLKHRTIPKIEFLSGKMKI